MNGRTAKKLRRQASRLYDRKAPGHLLKNDKGMAVYHARSWRAVYQDLKARDKQ